MQIMTLPKTAIVLDTRRKKQNDLYPVKLRVTFERKQVYFQTPHYLTEKVFKRVMYGERQTEKEKELKKKIQAFEDKAVVIIETLPFFTWQAFEKRYHANRAAKDTLNLAINERINKLKEAGQISTAITYECAKNSLNKFTPNSKFIDITPSLLTDYEKDMISNGNSKTNVLSLNDTDVKLFTTISQEKFIKRPSVQPYRTPYDIQN